MLTSNIKHLLEWLFWLIMMLWLYSQTSLFDKPIAEYAFGATGWPRMLCFLLLAGATGQLINNLFIKKATTKVAEASDHLPVTGVKLVTTIFFITPFIYLYLLPILGFYLLTPFFILVLLLLLGVRQIKPIAGVVSFVYFLMLLIFTRLFYVALPVGSVEWAYDINNAIIAFARSGV